MKNFSKNLLVAFLALLILSALFSLFARPFEAQKQISLSQLVQDINKGDVKSIVLEGTSLKVTLQDGSEVAALKESDSSLSQTLLNLGVDKKQLNNVTIEQRKEGGIGAWISPFLFVILPMLFFIFFFLMMFRQARAGLGQAFEFTKSRARLFGADGQTKEKVTFKDVAGLKEAKEELQEVVDFLKNPKKYLDMGARIPRGVLLVGAPGTGKTLLARAVANEAGVAFFSASGSEFVELFVGVGSARARDLFSAAKRAGRSIIFIDELDAIGRTRGSGFTGGHEEREQTLNQILVEMDGFERDDTRIVIAASVTGDTPVLTRKNGGYKLLPIAEVVDPYYQEGEEGIEKPSQRLEVLGFENKTGKGFSTQKKTYLQNSAFKKVRSVFRHKVQEIYEVEYMGGTIKTTGNHSVFVRTNNRGLVPKPVCEIKPGDILVDLPYKVNRTNKTRREVRAHRFGQELNLQLPLWEPLFMPFQSVEYAYQYARSHEEEMSQARLGNMLGFSQRTIGKWQQGICTPRALSRNYYQYQKQIPGTVKVTPELMRLFGYYTAEGYARKELDFCFNEKETEYLDDVKHLMKTVFNLDVDRERRITKNAVNIVYHCKPVASFFAFHCGKGAKNKRVPQFLFDAPKEYFVQFLSGYAAGDGYVDKQGRLELTSTSKQLICELNWLSRMHGFKSYVGEFTVRAGRTIYGGKPLPETKAYRLGFGKTQNPLDPKIGEANTKRAIVKSIRKLSYDGYVYDFCGCENEAFFGGESPILLHNTNRPDVLDSALLRPGRFDRRIVLDLPDVNDREEILKIHSAGKPLAPKTSLREIAERTPGFSGADLANLMNEAAILTARRNKTLVSQGELLESIDKVLLGPERKSHILSKKEKEITAYHEAGHALVASSLKNADPVRKVSIISRGRAGGYTLKLPSEEKHLKSRGEFLDELATFLGGYCAEKLVFKDVTTGASNDLQQASDMARRLVKEYGMSEKLGPVTFGEKEEYPFARIGEYVNYSQKLAQEIDKEVSRLLEQARKRAESILKQKRATLAKIAKVLVQKETIEREEFEQLIGKARPKPQALRRARQNAKLLAGRRWSARSLRRL